MREVTKDHILCDSIHRKVSDRQICTDSILVVASGWRRWAEEWIKDTGYPLKDKGYRVTLRGWEFSKLTVVMFAQFCKYIKNQLIAHIFFYRLIDLVVLGFSCSNQGLCCSLWHAEPLAVTCEPLVEACGIWFPDQGSSLVTWSLSPLDHVGIPSCDNFIWMNCMLCELYLNKLRKAKRK